MLKKATVHATRKALNTKANRYLQCFLDGRTVTAEKNDDDGDFHSFLCSSLCSSLCPPPCSALIRSQDDSNSSFLQPRLVPASSPMSSPFPPPSPPPGPSPVPSPGSSPLLTHGGEICPSARLFPSPSVTSPSLDVEKISVFSTQHLGTQSDVIPVALSLLLLSDETSFRTMSVSSSYRVNYQLKSHRRDRLIEVIKSLLLTPFVLETNHGKIQQETVNKVGTVLHRKYSEVFQKLEELIQDHINFQTQENSHLSKLSELVPNIGHFFTPLPLVKSFVEYDDIHRFTKRRFIPPSFNDVRHILNRAQVHAISPKLKLITFDADQTIYKDGKDLEKDGEICSYIIRLLQAGVKVAIVTAASYPNNPARYEARLAGLLEVFRSGSVPEDVSSQFYVMGGECSFLFRCQRGNLVQIPAEHFQLDEMLRWDEAEIQKMIDVAEKSLSLNIASLGLELSLLRKSRSVGTINPKNILVKREQLEEMALAAQHDIHNSGSAIPFCAFNGGSDVWVDLGNKLYGVQCLQKYFAAHPTETIHVGDQFLSIGNDVATRRACATLWVAEPIETIEVLDTLLKDIEKPATK